MVLVIVIPWLGGIIVDNCPDSRGQLAYDNPDDAGHVRRKFKREYIMSGGNLSGVYHFYTMAVTAATMV